MTGHVHAERMRLYAEDAAETEAPWKRWERWSEALGGWVPVAKGPMWAPSSEYRRKPGTITIGDMEVPEPMREAPEDGTRYWLASPLYPHFHVPRHWVTGDESGRLLRSGLCHTTKQAAIQHAKALIRVSGGKVPE